MSFVLSSTTNKKSTERESVGTWERSEWCKVQLQWSDALSPSKFGFSKVYHQIIYLRTDIKGHRKLSFRKAFHLKYFQAISKIKYLKLKTFILRDAPQFLTKLSLIKMY